MASKPEDPIDAKERKEIEELLMDKLPEVLDETQKYNKVTNLLASLRKEKFM